MVLPSIKLTHIDVIRLLLLEWPNAKMRSRTNVLMNFIPTRFKSEFVVLVP